MLGREVQDYFDTETITSGVMEAEEKKWTRIYNGHPDWAKREDKEEEGIESVNFAKKLCNETARLTTLALGIKIEGSPRADWLAKQIESYIVAMTKDKCEYACALGYIAIKPNGEGLDYVLPGNFVPTSVKDGKINGGIFVTTTKNGKTWYTRLEYHRFQGGQYWVTNKAFASERDNTLGKEIDLKNSPWNDLEEEATIEGLEKPLFSIFAMPAANHIEVGSPIPVSIFSNAITELKRLDIAQQRMADEIYDSGKTVFMGDALWAGDRGILGKLRDRQGRKIPRYVRAVSGSIEGDDYHEINPTIQTTERLKGIDHYLDSAGTKCGYSTGQFVLNGRTGQITATQVEADDRETIQLIKQIRDSLQSATDDLIYALDKWADLYDITPVGDYETTYDFGDITYNKEEDRDRNWKYVQAGKYPFWRYLVRFEGYSEEEAKQIEEEVKESQKEEGLFEET